VQARPFEASATVLYHYAKHVMAVISRAVESESEGILGGGGKNLPTPTLTSISNLK
jgi:hypothetical protein